nr:Mov34/MPN/PAD-1 family protein [Candidatus Sigynarchaeota archaeon]
DIRDKAAPHEACGLLFGSITTARDRSGCTFACQVLRELKSAKQSPVYFELDPVEQYTISTDEESKGRALVGVLHTHPGGQFVSSTDADYMRNFARFFQVCWVIAGDGLDGLDVGAYMVDSSGEIIQIPIYTRAGKGF